ncbi:uncharacterized protein LOC129456551 [Periophthalmus magnuspinnatus]|uniref:uncharacterized protein LOC129456551 n=1 Tax=Periophthalmus magnuspinnatus TaxID=409849 RepID=UPI002436CD7F|nr:uncharacterized protein LOC129456551 [Periophthalmus magnuspinnatus]
MEKSPLDQKPRAVSDTSKNYIDQDHPHIRDRSFTDIQKIIKKDASANTPPLHTSEMQPRASSSTPLTENRYMYETVLRPDMKVKCEQDYKENSSKNMNVEYSLWNTKPATDGRPNKEMTWKKKKDETDENSEKVSGNEDFSGLSKTHQTNSHKRNESAWSFGSFQIGPPVDLVAEVLSGEEWAGFLENKQKFPPDLISSPTIDYYESVEYVPVFNQEIAHGAVECKSTIRQSKSMGILF